jgi:hypothetical protein
MKIVIEIQFATSQKKNHLWESLAKELVMNQSKNSASAFRHGNTIGNPFQNFDASPL